MDTLKHSEIESVTYESFNNPAPGQTTIQGIRDVLKSTNVYIAGSFLGTNNIVQGLIYEGPLAGNGSEGEWHIVNFPSTDGQPVVNTSCYGPNNAPNGMLQMVGSYKTAAATGMLPSGNLGFYYEGPVDGSGTWIQVSPNGGNTNNVFVHSIMGGIAVGNFDVENDKNGYAFLYDVATQKCVKFMLPNSLTTTLYGIWYNGDNDYTLVGGYTTPEFENISQAFIVDYNAETKEINNLKSFSHSNETRSSIITHFEGITRAEYNGYNMPADWVSAIGEGAGASFVNVLRNKDGSFGDAYWTDITYPDASTTSANTVYKNNVLGIAATSNDSGEQIIISFNAEVN